MRAIKEEIISNFSLAAKEYDHFTHIQVRAAQRLAQYANIKETSLPDGPVLEIGCGTGAFTIPLLDQIQNRSIIISDLSPQMLEQCRERIIKHFGSIPENVTLSILDAEQLEEPETYALICSSFTIQWFTHLESTAQSLLKSLKKQGQMIFSVPSDQSFPEWKELCRNTNTSYTGNILPSIAKLQAVAKESDYFCHLCEEKMAYNYTSFYNFLNSMKSCGAATSTHKIKLVTIDLLKLIKYAENKNPHGFVCTCNVIFGKILKA